MVDTSNTSRTVRSELQAALDVACRLSNEALPSFLGELETIRAIAWVRLTTPIHAEHVSDELLDVREAARRLGTTPNFLYHHHHRLPFTKRLGRNLRFSAHGLEAYIRRDNGVRQPVRVTGS
jgi:hypothetical protein